MVDIINHLSMAEGASCPDIHHCLKNKQLKLNAFSCKDPDPAKGVFNIMHTRRGVAITYI